ncbi:MAG: exonuclease domain-containing protein [Rubrimonas sp.]|uniref:3'-5' exonuclease n=1 Tax=Rubrimonas sp. TaxID=2036015 RepID=UPI002FDDADD6
MAKGRLAARLSLRVRFVLFFALIAVGALALVGGALVVIWLGAEPELRRSVALHGGGALFALIGLVVWVGLKFDENVALPIERIGRDARAAAHGGALRIDERGTAKYLGLLGPAAGDLAASLAAARRETEAAVKRATAEAKRRRRQLETVLRDLDQGVLICTLDHKILLYNRRALEILHVSGELGLGRSLFTLVSAQPFRHALERVTARFQDGRHTSHPLALAAPVVCATADGGRTLQGRLTLMLNEREAAPSGYVATFEDATEQIAEHLRRDRLLRRITDEFRPALGELTAAGEMLAEDGLDPAERRVFEARLLREAQSLAERIASFEAEARELSTVGWPMSDVFSPTLFTSIIRRRTGPQNFSAEIVGDPVWLHCDSVAIVEMVDVLMNRIAEAAATRAFTLGAAQRGAKVYVDLRWKGPVIAADAFARWLSEPLDASVGGVTPREVLDLHRAEFWCEEEGDGWARLRLPLPGPKEAHLGRAPAVERRPEFYDFDLLNRSAPTALEDTPLRELDCVVFDTETTGLDPSGGDRIISVAGVRIVNGRVLRGEVFDQLINPGRRIPEASIRIHQISNEMVADAPPAAQVLRRFHAFAQGSVLAAHNAAFDMRFLALEEKTSGVVFDQPVLDTVLLAAHLHGQTDSLTLDALAARFAIEIPPDARHTALGDSLATAEVLLRLFDMLDAAGVRTLGEALAASRGAGAIRRRQAAY